MKSKYRKMYGIGVNDADYKTRLHEYVDGKKVTVWRCPYYALWSKLMYRCYSKSFHKIQPTYTNVEVCQQWHTFSNFKSWMEKQDWEGKEIDKDLLSTGSKVYSPETCVFISHQLNMYLVSKSKEDSALPVGVSYDKERRKYKSQIGRGRGVTKALGRFNTPEEAHRAWQHAKYMYGLELLKEQDNPRVIQAMHVILHKLGEDWAAGRETKALIPAKTP